MKKAVLFMLVVTMVFSTFMMAVNAADEEIHGFSYNSNDYFSTNVEEQTGSGKTLGESGWRSVNGTTEGTMGNDDDAWFYINGEKKTMYLSTRPTRTSGWTCYNTNDKNIPALVYNTPSKYLTGDQTIKFNSYIAHSTGSFGVRFKVHNDGKNYYAVVFGGDWIADNNNGPQISYKIYKFVNGEIADYKEGKAADGNIQTGEFPVVNISCEGATISFELVSDNGSGTIVRTWKDSWTDKNPFTFSETDTATVWLTACGNKGDNKRFAYFKNIEINSVSSVTGTYDDGTLKYDTRYKRSGDTITDAKATITGFSAGATNDAKKTLTVPATVTDADGIEYTVTKIANDAFKGVKELLYIEAGESALEEIGDSSFRGSEVRTVKLPSTLTTISGSAFRGCSYLNAINIPEKVTKIGYCAFYQVLGGKSDTYLNITFEGNAIKLNQYDIDFPSGRNNKIKATVSHPDVKSAVENYCSSYSIGCETEYAMLYKNGTAKFYAPSALNNDMFIVALYNGDTLINADVKNITASAGESYEYNLAENNIDLSGCTQAKAFLLTNGELTPLAVSLTLK